VGMGNVAQTRELFVSQGEYSSGDSIVIAMMMNNAPQALVGPPVAGAGWAVYVVCRVTARG